MHILVIDSTPGEFERTWSKLSERVHQIDCARSLEQARALLTESSDIDVILLDLTLPESTGMLCFHEVRMLAHWLPIVIFATDDDQTLALSSVRNGAQDYLIKGVASDDSIIRCLQYAVERNRFALDLKRGQERLRAILEHSYDGFLSMDRTWHITDWNLQAAQTFGWQREQIV